MENDFSAVYLPVRPAGKPDPSRSGFATREEAEQYIFEHGMCSSCMEERRKALTGEWDRENEWEPSEYPGCFYEWIVVPTKEEGYEDFEELMQAGGWGKLVYVSECQSCKPESTIKCADECPCKCHKEDKQDGKPEA